MNLSLAQKILRSQKPFVFYHTHIVTRESLQEAIKEGQSMDLDICVDDMGEPYLGHVKEYYDKSGEKWGQSMPLWEAVGLISQAKIVVMIDCKHQNSWPFIEQVITKIGQEKCLVNSYILELNYDYQPRGYNVVCQWSPLQTLKALKDRYPLITTSASAKGLPNNLLISNRYRKLLQHIRVMLKDNSMDTVSLNVPDETMSDKILDFFLEENIIPHVKIDNIDINKLAGVYVGETDNLKSASRSRVVKSKEYGKI